MPQKIELTLPVPPSVNRIWRRSKHGGMYKVKQAVAYDEAVLAAWTKARLPRLPFRDGAVRYVLRWYRYPAKGDASNRVKVVEDALNGLAWTDDEQVVDLRVIREDVAKGKQRITITIEAAE